MPRPRGPSSSRSGWASGAGVLSAAGLRIPSVTPACLCLVLGRVHSPTSPPPRSRLWLLALLCGPTDHLLPNPGLPPQLLFSGSSKMGSPAPCPLAGCSLELTTGCVVGRGGRRAWTRWFAPSIPGVLARTLMHTQRKGVFT